MFEDVVSPRGAPAGRRRLKAGPVALGVHALVIGGALASALLNGEDLSAPDPPVPIVYQTTSSPPDGAPRAADGARRGSSREPQRITALRPREAAEPMPSAADLAEPAEAWGAEEIGPGEPGAGPSGVPGGLGTGGGDPAGPGEERIHEVGGAILAPRLVHKVDPTYPDTARKLRIEGVVIVRAIIGTDGRVEDVRIAKALFPSLDGAVLEAIGQWRYEPATLRGRAVRVALTVTVDFQLR
ncbi:MAG TPA: TonB family protein [Thermoanaerobaculia bacterium]|jgi:protein TonB